MWKWNPRRSACASARDRRRYRNATASRSPAELIQPGPIHPSEARPPVPVGSQSAPQQVAAGVARDVLDLQPRVDVLAATGNQGAAGHHLRVGAEQAHRNLVSGQGGAQLQVQPMVLRPRGKARFVAGDQRGAGIVILAARVQQRGALAQDKTH